MDAFGYGLFGLRDAARRVSTLSATYKISKSFQNNL